VALCWPLSGQGQWPLSWYTARSSWWPTRGWWRWEEHVAFPSSSQCIPSSLLTGHSQWCWRPSQQRATETGGGVGWQSCQWRQYSTQWNLKSCRLQQQPNMTRFYVTRKCRPHFSNFTYEQLQCVCPCVYVCAGRGACVCVCTCACLQ